MFLKESEQLHEEHNPITLIDIFTLPNKNTIGWYQNEKVVVRRYYIGIQNISRNLLLEVNKMRKLSHARLSRFVAICLENGSLFVMMGHAERGSLQDLIGSVLPVESD